MHADRAAAPMYIELPMLEQAFDPGAILEAIRTALIDHVAGRFVQPAPLHLGFANGECHVKAGYLRGGSTFAVKIATGFYANHRRHLPYAHAMLLLSSQETGLPITLFEDRGM